MKKMRVLWSRLLLLLVLGYGQTASALHLIPTLYMDTKDRQAVLSRDIWKDSTLFRLVMPDGTVAYQAGNVAVKARGHSTFNKPKKPYTFRLQEEKGLLGMRPDKRWILLANFMDHSNIRNSLAFAISRQTSLDWTPDGRFVDVVLNGKLQGCYYLTESVEVEPQRLNLDQTNGFLVEGDDYDDGSTFYTSIRNLPLHVRFPENVSAARQTSIEQRFNEIERLLYKGTPADPAVLYRKYIDLNSFIDWWLVHELAQNAEPNGPRSCYFHDNGDGRLRMGPVWDFDLAFITVGLDNGGDIRPSRFNRTDVRLLTGDSLYNSRALWYGKLLEDETFQKQLKKRWNLLKPRFESLSTNIDEWERLLAPSAADNDSLWKGADPARFDTYDTFHNSIDNVKHVYLHRIAALDKLITNLK